jgi:hypothetical protein
MAKKTTGPRWVSMNFGRTREWVAPSGRRLGRVVKTTGVYGRRRGAFFASVDGLGASPSGESLSDYFEKPEEAVAHVERTFRAYKHVLLKRAQDDVERKTRDLLQAQERRDAVFEDVRAVSAAEGWEEV